MRWLVKIWKEASSSTPNKLRYYATIYVHTYGTTTKIQMYLCKLVWKDQLSKTVINNLLGILVCYTTYKYKEFMDQ